MSYMGIQEAYTLLLYSLMATDILNFFWRTFGSGRNQQSY